MLLWAWIVVAALAGDEAQEAAAPTDDAAEGAAVPPVDGAAGADDAKPGDRDFTAPDSAALGVDPVALEALRTAAAEASSDAVVVMKGGQVVADWSFGTARGQIETMSVTKSVVAVLVVGLLAERDIPLSTPVSRWFPEWGAPPYDVITVEHLLAHTSGVRTDPTTEAIYDAPDIVAYALAQPVVDPPGARFTYNNTTANLLPAIVARETGTSVEAHARAGLFAELGIDDLGWTTDPAGNHHGMSGLQLRPMDLARVGQALLDGHVPAAVVDELARPRTAFSPGYGLGWWLAYRETHCIVDELLLEVWAADGVPRWFVRDLEVMVDRRHPDSRAFFEDLRARVSKRAVRKWEAMTWQAGRPDCHEVVEGPPVSLAGNGYLGQHLVVLPEEELVAVRMIRWRPEMPKGSGLGDFPERVRALVAPADGGGGASEAGR